MAVNPFGGVPRNLARGLQLTDGRASISVLKKGGTVGLNQQGLLKRSTVRTRLVVKPPGAVIKPPKSITLANPLRGTNSHVTTPRVGRRR